MCNLHNISLFALVLHILHSFLSQSELSNFFVYIIRLPYHVNVNSLLLHFAIVYASFPGVKIVTFSFFKAGIIFLFSGY